MLKCSKFIFGQRRIQKGKEPLSLFTPQQAWMRSSLVDSPVPRIYSKRGLALKKMS